MPLCRSCRLDLPQIISACQQCAIPLKAAEILRCGQCIQDPPSVDYAISLYHYETPLDYLIGQLKYHQKLSYASIMGDLLKEKILNLDVEHQLPQAIIAVPLYKKRLLQRGFNQSLEIVKSIAKEKKIPILLDAVDRVRDTPTQRSLNKKERKKNVKGCFDVVREIKQSHIVIVDDVVTTGATSNELARVLKTAGVGTVGVWSIARAETK